MNSRGGVRTGVGLRCPRSAAARLRRRHLTSDDVRGARALYRNPFSFRAADRSIALFNPTESILAFTPRPYGFSAASRNHALTYRWNFGDPDSGWANRATGLDVLHVFPRGGTYTITLEVLDGGTVIATQRNRLTLF